MNFGKASHNSYVSLLWDSHSCTFQIYSRRTLGEVSSSPLSSQGCTKHNTHLVKIFLVKNNVTDLEHPPAKKYCERAPIKLFQMRWVISKNGLQEISFTSVGKTVIAQEKYFQGNVMRTYVINRHGIIEVRLDKTQHLPEDKFYKRRLSFLFLS